MSVDSADKLVLTNECFLSAFYFGLSSGTSGPPGPKFFCCRVNFYGFPLVANVGIKLIPTGDKFIFSYRGTFLGFPVVTSIGIKFVGTGDKYFSFEGVPLGPSHWLLV